MSRLVGSARAANTRDSWSSTTTAPCSTHWLNTNYAGGAPLSTNWLKKQDSVRRMDRDCRAVVAPALVVGADVDADVDDGRLDHRSRVDHGVVEHHAGPYDGAFLDDCVSSEHAALDGAVDDDTWTEQRRRRVGS